MGVARKAAPIVARFLPKFRHEDRGFTTHCWIWTSSVRPNGYSQFRYSKAKNGYGHIFAYEHFIGPVPPATTLDHLCRNRACVNPYHLEAVPHQTNVLRGEGEAAKNARKTHCKRGHPLSGDNVYVNAKTKRRICRTCQKEATKAWRDKHPEEHAAYHREYVRKWRAEHPEAYERQRESQREYNRRLREDAKKWREAQSS